MEQLLQQFEAPIRDANGNLYVVYLYGRERLSDTWQGWLVFERRRDSVRFATPVETTQPNAQAIVYWATGLTATYFDGALQRALSPDRTARAADVSRPAPAFIRYGADTATRRRRLTNFEREIMRFFERLRATRALTQQLFDASPHAHADIVRALEDLEKQGGYLVRSTEEGNDWLFLTEQGIRAAGLSDLPRRHEVETR
jgi:hypothetical protein